MTVQFFWPRVWIQAHSAQHAIWYGISLPRGIHVGYIIWYAHTSS
jgi:hypothetical protein